MRRIHYMPANANNSLAPLLDYIPEAFQRAEEFILKKFKINWEVDVVVTSRMSDILIPEDGVGGRTYASDFIVINIEPKQATIAKLSEMLIHELGHAIRWGYNSEWAKDLFSELISEGIATQLEAEFTRIQTEKTFFLETILKCSSDNNREILDLLKPNLQDNNYKYNDIFFGGGIFPRWSGYSAGFYRVQKYLEITGKNIFQAIAEPYEDYWKILRDAAVI